ncbi:MAG: hypothetical protein ACF8MJ_04485 [Phycisphaerales bacterium JB050]
MKHKTDLVRTYGVSAMMLVLGTALGMNPDPALAQDAPSSDAWERVRAVEPDSLTYQSFAKASDALDRAIEVHGGGTIEEAYTDIAMSFLGSGVRTASQRFVGESVEYSVRGAVGFSKLFDALSFIEEITVGEQSFRGYTIVSRDQILRIPTGEELPEPEPDIETEEHTVRMIFPYYWLGRARDARESLRWLGEYEISGSTLHAISFADADGGATLLLDPESGVLRRVELLTTHFVQGDATGWIEFDGYEDLAGHQFPTVRRERSVEGRFIREAQISFDGIRAETILPANIFSVPPQFRFAAPDWTVTENPIAVETPTLPWNQVAPGLYWVDLADVANTQVLVIEHEHGCTVFNSPLTDQLAGEVLRSIEKNLPGKPVERIVCATFHPRFAGGLRTYLAAGAKIVTTPANEEYIRKILETPTRLVPDAPEVTLADGDIVLVDGEMTFGDGDDQLLVYDIGEKSAYTESYLVGWLPETRILLTSDLFAVLDSGRVRGASDRTQGLALWIAEAGVEPLQLIPTSPVNDHKRIMLIEDLEDSLQATTTGFTEIGPPMPGQ